MKTDGKYIKDNFGNGKIIYLRGVNIGGWLIQEPWMTPIGIDKSENEGDEENIRNILINRFGETGIKSQENLYNRYQDTWITEYDIKKCAEMGMTVLRLPFYWRNIMNKNGEWKKDPWKRFDWFINTCKKYNLYVILDFHGLPGSQNGKDHSGKMGSADLWKDKWSQDTTEKIWDAVAERYKNNTVVAGYDLINEPGQISNIEEWKFINRLYLSIREIDNNHIIFIESTWDFEDLPNPKDMKWENVVYEFHYYCFKDFNNYKVQTEFIKNKVKDYQKHLDYNIPVYIGEFNFFNNIQVWHTNLNIFNENEWHWTMWTYKSTCTWNNWNIYGRSNYEKINIQTASYAKLSEYYGSWLTESKFRPAEINGIQLKNIIKKYLINDLK